MYSPIVTERHLKQTVKAARRTLNDPEFEYQYHSPADCQQAIDYFSHKLDRFQKLNERDPLPSECWDAADRRWMLNERNLCQLDFEYFRSHYAKIRNANGSIVLATPNVAQLILSSIYADFESRDLASEIQSLKARQLGVSTDTEIRIGHRAFFYSNVNAFIASSDPDQSEKMSHMVELMYNELPFWLKPVCTVDRAGQLWEFGGQNSGITIEHGTQVRGIARGTTPDVCHLSECSEYDKPEELIDASLRKAMHHGPLMLLMLESTAKGMRNWWHKEWLKNKEMWPRGMTACRPSFLPWYVGTDMWPTSTWLKQCPIPSDWTPSDEVIKHAEKSRAYVLSNDLLSRHLGSAWKLPRTQMWYYECQREEARRKNTLNKLLEELPADDMEAFQHTGHSVFSVELVQAYRDRTREPLAVYGIQAPECEISIRLQAPASQVDPSKPSIDVRCHWDQSRPPYDYTFVPLKWNGYQEDDGFGKLYLWGYPENGIEYGVGCDSSAGIGLDRTTVEVFNKVQPGLRFSQWAEYASPNATPIDIWPILFAIATFFSVRNAAGELRQAKVICETMSETDLAQHELRKRGWWNFHDWKRIDHANLDTTPYMLGWHTTNWSRRQLIAWMITLLRDFDIDISSPYLVEEIADLAGDEDTQKIKAVYGSHDDRFINAGFTFYSLHWNELLRGAMSLSSRSGRGGGSGQHTYSRYTPPVAERCFSDDEQKLLQLGRMYEQYGRDRYGH